jgi:hypothetical protein
MTGEELTYILASIQRAAMDALYGVKSDKIKVTITVSCEGKWVQTIVARERPPKL